LTLIRKELWRWRYFNWFDKNGVNPENQSEEKVGWFIDLLGSAA